MQGTIWIISRPSTSSPRVSLPNSIRRYMTWMICKTTTNGRRVHWNAKGSGSMHKHEALLSRTDCLVRYHAYAYTDYRWDCFVSFLSPSIPTRTVPSRALFDDSFVSPSFYDLLLDDSYSYHDSTRFHVLRYCSFPMTRIVTVGPMTVPLLQSLPPSRTSTAK